MALPPVLARASLPRAHFCLSQVRRALPACAIGAGVRAIGSAGRDGDNRRHLMRATPVHQPRPHLRLGREFYAREVLTVARDCIGKLLVHRTPEGAAAGRIVEAEAYRGPLDLAAHSARGLTRRTAAMFGPPGYAYVYFLYGSCWAMNLVVASEGEPHAVLIRAIEPVRGVALMARRRGRPADSRDLTNGPGKLTAALAIDGADYGRDLCGGTLFLEDDGRPCGPVGTSARINVDYAGDWARRRWRFYERGNRYVSVAPRD
jgi:DNA-3-methyladenine glycosylase